MFWIVNKDQFGTLVALDGKELWLLHLAVPAAKDFDDIDLKLAIPAALGVEIPMEILGIERWTSRRLVADRYRDRNVFLAGDAAHIWIPLGGFGMNAGIGDATHLAWLLSAEYHGWAGPRLLDAYQAERRPTGDLVSGAAIQIMKNRGPAMHVEDGLEDDTQAGESRRRAMGERIVAADASQFNSVGVQLGYYYNNSPINVDDGSPPPAFSLDKFVPTSRPGSRAPHAWLRDGTSLYDALGPDFTLLHLGTASCDSHPLEDAAKSRKVPIKVLELPEPEVLKAYENFSLVLIWPEALPFNENACARS